MGVITIPYSNASRGNELININYHDGTHQVINGEPTGNKVASGLVAGVKFYTQVVGTLEYQLFVSNTAPYATVKTVDKSPALPQDFDITSVDVSPAWKNHLGSAIINAVGTGAKRYWVDALNHQDSNAFANLIAGRHTANVVPKFGGTGASRFFTVPYINDLSANATKVDCTANGSDDGQVVISVLDGSGSYHVEYDDGYFVDLNGNEANTTIRTGLEPGIYSGTITDNVTGQVVSFSQEIIEPPPVVVPPPIIIGNIFYFPFMNSISFVVSQMLSCESPQGVDNVLLADQVYKGIERANYYQRFNRCDKPTIQFNSDFTDHIIELRKCNGDVVKQLNVLLKEQNIGKTEAFEVAIQNDTVVGRSRIYFNTSAIPIPVAINDTFQISNNADGFNGSYLVLDINIDTLVGKQYIVFNHTYTPNTGSSNATATFNAQTVNFNVHEAQLDFLDVPDGKYYLYTKASSSNDMEAISEPLWVKQEHDDTIKMEFRHRKNGHGGMTWSTGITVMYRVEGHWGNLRSPGGDVTINRNADNSGNLVNSKPTRVIPVTLVMLPPYVFEKLGLGFKSNVQIINGVEVVATENMSEVEYRTRTLFGTAAVKVEQKNWFGPYTNTGIGTIVDGGYLTTETGLLKR